MMGKAILIFVLLGTVSSEPIRRSIIMPNDMIPSFLSNYAEQLELSIRPETIRSVKNFINSVVGLKLSALEIATQIVRWLASNLIGIAIGSILAFGFCKISGKCSLSYDSAFSNLYSFITSERLEMAQNLLINGLAAFEQQDNTEESKKEAEEDEAENETENEVYN